jgi:hypothetical protein
MQLPEYPDTCCIKTSKKNHLYKLSETAHGIQYRENENNSNIISISDILQIHQTAHQLIINIIRFSPRQKDRAYT